MSAVVKLLLLGFFLNAHCEEYGVSLPKQMVALTGSCLTIPCSFTVPDKHKQNLHSGCRASWDGSNFGPHFTRQKTGDLTQKNCTTTVHGLTEEHSRDFHFNIDCNNDLNGTFDKNPVNIVVKDAPPTPTLTPPTLSVREGQSVSVQCSAPVPCPSAPPTLTWSPVLGRIEETLQEQEDKTFVKVSTLRFNASHLHHEKNITCSAVYRMDDGSLSHASEQMRPFVTFPPQILSSSNCTGDSSQIVCVCETEGNPFPLIQWSFPGVFPNISFSSVLLSDKALRSVLTVVKPQWNDSVTLVCHSSNSLGSDTKAFEHGYETKAFQQSGIGSEVTLPLLITLIVILLGLIGVLLFVIRAQHVRQSADLDLNQIPLPPNEAEQRIEVLPQREPRIMWF